MRSIRESYKISQKEIGDLLQVEQSTISKFESASQKAQLDFLMSYANVLGYQIVVGRSSEPHGELLRFRARQARISKELSGVKLSRIEAELKTLLLQGDTILEIDAVEEKRRIMSKLLEAKSNREKSNYRNVSDEFAMTEPMNVSHWIPDVSKKAFSTKVLSEGIGVSKRMIQQFERDKSYMPKASFVFKYVPYMNRELHLAEKFQHPGESIGAFYIRNCLALHNAVDKSAGAVERVQKAVKKLLPNGDKYAEFVYILRKTRESYKISQEEMAKLMNMTQSVISNFESVNVYAKLDFLLSYAILLGYNIRLTEPFKGSDEISRFKDRQSEITRMASNYFPHQIEGKYRSGRHLKYKAMGETVVESKRQIMFNLNLARHCVNNENLTKYHVYNRLPSQQRNSLLRTLPDKLEELTPQNLATKLKASVNTMRRFESDREYMPSASLVFKYAAVVKRELRLVAEMYDFKETYGEFFLRRSFLLYDWIRILLEKTNPGV